MEEQSKDEKMEKTWNEQLLEWFDNSNHSKAEVARKTGIPKSTIKDYMSGKSGELSKVSQERRRALYNLTSLDIFKSKGEDENLMEMDTIRDMPNNVFSILNRLESYVSDLKRTLVREGANVLMTGGNPNPEERLKVVETAIDLLVEQIDYYRSASQKERESLAGYLINLNEIDRFGYVTNMLNQIHKASGGTDTFLRSMNPPKKYKGENKK